jgi:N-acetyl-alpha-D-glucosaminyl L-malate synthase BshA
MRIGVTCHPSAGGSGILATELGIAMAERGHSVHFVTFESPFRLQDFHANLYSHYATAVTYPMLQQSPGTLALSALIADIAEEHDIELWHAHYAIPYAACAIMARDMLPPEKRFKVVTTLHGTDITLVGTDPSFFRVTQYSMERSDAVTAVSDWLRRETEREFHPSRPIERIYNFLDVDRFTAPRTHRCCLANNGEKIVMHVSNFRPVKRVTDVVRAFKKIQDRIPARLVMVGDGPERISAVGVARQLGITDKVKFLGNQSDVERLLVCADLVFQPSEHESFGLVALEAMACEVPVLATASGGVSEVIEHGVTGFLCEVGDIDAMAGYATTILMNPKRAKEMGRLARESVLKEFSKEKIVPQYEALYNRVLNGEHKSSLAETAG